MTNFIDMLVYFLFVGRLGMSGWLYWHHDRFKLHKSQQIDSTIIQWFDSSPVWQPQRLQIEKSTNLFWEVRTLVKWLGMHNVDAWCFIFFLALVSRPPQAKKRCLLNVNFRTYRLSCLLLSRQNKNYSLLKKSFSLLFNNGLMHGWTRITPYLVLACFPPFYWFPHKYSHIFNSGNYYRNANVR